MSENKISRESAELQIQEMFDYFLLDKEDIANEEGEEVLNTVMNMLTRGIQKGLLEITTEDGLKVTQHLKQEIDGISKIEYIDKVAKAKIAMGTSKSKNAQLRMNEFMSTLGDVPVQVLAKMQGADLTIFGRVALVFSMV